MATPNPQRLVILTELRQAARLTLSDMAQRCGLRGRQSHQTAGAWELGNMTPTARRRVHFLGYLWDNLGLRHESTRFEEIWEMLCEEWDWEPIGDQEWRQLTNQPRSATQAHHPVQAPLPTLPITPAVPFQAPPVTAHFVGRAETMQQVLPLLTAPIPTRSVALVGMGGIGKTTLAIHLAHTLQSHFADGVLWAQTAISTPLDILQSWARAFGYDYSELHDVESCAAALRSALAERQILFVLDNVESVQRVKPLLIGREGSAVLLTTRSEDVAVALGSQVIPLVELSSDESTQLLTKLLGAERVARETAAALQIGELLHHLPLAVEIVGQLLAARSRRPLAQMAQRLQDVGYRLDLQISDRDVRTSFLVSWEALDGEQQRLFAHLAVFAGRSFTVHALVALLDEDEDAVLEQLDLLVARSLVKEVAIDRYSQHPLLADFAREQLGDAPAVWARFAESQLAFAKENQTDYEALEPEWENLMAGMAAAHRSRMWELVLEYAAVLGEAWVARAEYTRARQGYSLAADAAQYISNEQLMSSLIQWGYACSEQKDFVEAKQRLTRVMHLASTHQWHKYAAQAKYHLVSIAIEQGEYEEADDLLIDCLEYYQQISDNALLAKSEYLQAFLQYRNGEYTKAKLLCQDVLRRQQKAGEMIGTLATLRLLIDIAIDLDQYHVAETYGEMAIQIATYTRRKAELAESTFCLATIYRLQKRLDKAWHYSEEARKTFEQIGNLAFIAYVYYEQSMVTMEMGDYQSALEKNLESNRLMQELNDNYNRIICLLRLGEIYRQTGDAKRAQEVWAEGRELARSANHPKFHEFDSALESLG